MLEEFIVAKIPSTAAVFLALLGVCKERLILHTKPNVRVATVGRDSTADAAVAAATA